MAYCQRWRENRLRLVFSRLIEGYSVNSQPGPSKGSQAFFIFVVESPGWVDGILANPRAPVIGHPHETFLCSSLDFLRIDTWDILQDLDTLQVFEDYGLNGLKKSHDLSAVLYLFFFFFFLMKFILIKIIKQISIRSLLWFIQELWKWLFWNHLEYERYFIVKNDDQSLR